MNSVRWLGYGNKWPPNVGWFQYKRELFHAQETVHTMIEGHTLLSPGALPFVRQIFVIPKEKAERTWKRLTWKRLTSFLKVLAPRWHTALLPTFHCGAVISWLHLTAKLMDCVSRNSNGFWWTAWSFCHSLLSGHQIFICILLLRYIKHTPSQERHPKSPVSASRSKSRILDNIQSSARLGCSPLRSDVWHT